MAGYSSKPLLQKLGLKPEFKVCFINAPKGYAKSLGPLPPDVRVLATPKPPLDFIHCFFDSRAELDVVREPWGTVAFPKLTRGTVAEMCTIAREKYETTVVPGEYFDMPDHFRIGIGGETDLLEEGLRRLGLALDDIGG